LKAPRKENNLKVKQTFSKSIETSTSHLGNVVEHTFIQKKLQDRINRNFLSRKIKNPIKFVYNIDLETVQICYKNIKNNL